ncbi:MAG: DNA-3-methyladenine glycosylase I, partial [Candidatus Lokiarchaeia archaeon]|nr:DNA-3-methyladenine glycosylase I [Candidatus Lokiarchaeia archaeon]
WRTILNKRENFRKAFDNFDYNKVAKYNKRKINSLLKDEGIIKKFTIEYRIDNKPRTRATVKVEPDFKEIKRILKELLEIEEITNIWRLSGDCGLFMKVEIESIEKFNPLIEEKISQIKGVKIVETCFITDVIK